MTKQNTLASITIAHLSEELLDVLNGMNAVISTLAEKAGLSSSQVRMIQMEASQKVQRAKVKAEKVKADREAYNEDSHQMASWVHATRFDFDTPEDWAKAAAIEWECICERNGSEHGRGHEYSFKAPTQDELLEALQEFQQWSRATEPHNAPRRAHAIATLPKVKQKLAVLLAA